VKSPETLFAICSAVVLPGWLLLLFAPHWQRVTQLVAAVITPLLLAAIYAYLVLRYFGQSESGFGSLAEVGKLFQDPHALLAGWIHYLVFDLFIGSWQVRESRRLQISHFMVAPCLVLTFLFGPIGLLLFFILRAVTRRQFSLETENATR